MALFFLDNPVPPRIQFFLTNKVVCRHLLITFHLFYSATLTNLLYTCVTEILNSLCCSQELTFLTEWDLSYNDLQDVQEFPFRLPSVSKLNVAGNGIQDIAGMDCGDTLFKDFDFVFLGLANLSYAFF